MITNHQVGLTGRERPSRLFRFPEERRHAERVRSATAPSRGADGPGVRVLLVSQRANPNGIGRKPAYAAWYEAEDVLRSVVETDLMLLEQGAERTRIRARRFVGRNLRRSLAPERSIPTTARHRPPADHYDVAVFIPFTAWELPLLEEIGRLRDVAARVVVYLPEVWPMVAGDQRLRYEPWHLVDDIFVGIHPSIAVMAENLGREVRHLPMAADVHSFRPRTLDDPRPIDVLNIGRRIPGLHEELLKWADRTHRFYRYDTFRTASIDDPIQHRRDLGQWYQRASVALCSYPKHDRPEETRGLRVVPQRLWEGLAGGAVMIGMPPDEELQRIAVGEAVVEHLPADPEEGVAAIEKLVDGDTREIRRRNLDLALRRHDWVHRWITMFEALGSDVPPDAIQRAKELSGIADALD